MERHRPHRSRHARNLHRPRLPRRTAPAGEECVLELERPRLPHQVAHRSRRRNVYGQTRREEEAVASLSIIWRTKAIAHLLRTVLSLRTKLAGTKWRLSL